MSLRFGIQALQIDQLIPAGSTPEQALAQVAGFDQANNAAILIEQGFNPIELGGDMAMFLPHTYQPTAIERLAALKAKIGASYTLHLPLWSVEPSTPLTSVREGSVQAIIDCIQATRSLEPEVYVLHATGALAAEFYRMQIPEMVRTYLLAQFQSSARTSIQKILAETGIPSRKLAIETIEFPLDLTLELANDLDLSVCLDTGHVLVGFSGPVDFFEALEQCLPRLAEVHLHDGPSLGPHGQIGYGQDHQALGQGDLEVGSFIDRLVAAQFQGPIIFELSLAEAQTSMALIRTLRPEVGP